MQKNVYYNAFSLKERLTGFPEVIEHLNDMIPVNIG